MRGLISFSNDVVPTTKKQGNCQHVIAVGVPPLLLLHSSTVIVDTINTEISCDPVTFFIKPASIHSF